jgi:glycosyltransferase involved in cell wall biosynthesis
LEKTSGDKIRVLRIINRFNLGGITYNVSFLSRYMPARYETLLIGGPEEKGEESSLYIPHSLGLTPVIIGEMRRSVNPLWDIKAYYRIRKVIREFGPHIVHTHASKAGAIGRLAAIHAGVPVIVHTFHGHVFHGYFNSLISSIVRKTEQYLARRTSAIVAISNIQKEEICEKYQITLRDKTHVIPLGFDLEKFRTDQSVKRAQFRIAHNVDEGTIAVGIIGRLAPVKNHRLFIQAVKAVSKLTTRPFRAFIIGDGALRKELEAYAGNDLHEPANGPLITFTGWIREADIALAGLDIVALTSVNEGTPVSLLEAQAAGRFIVSTEVGGIKDILHPDCGLLSQSGNLEAFRDNLLNAISGFDVYSQRAGSASQEVIKKFSYERLCADMDRLYTTLAANAGLKINDHSITNSNGKRA